MKRFTCQEGEVCRAGDGEVRRCDIQGFDSILGHFVKVWRVHITVVIPAEPVEGDEQQLLPLFINWSAEDGWDPEEAETRRPQHGEHGHFTHLYWLYPPASAHIYEWMPHLWFLLATAPEQSFTKLSYRVDWTELISALFFMQPNDVYEPILRLELAFTLNFPLFCSGGLAVKLINLSGHCGCSFLP